MFGKRKTPPPQQPPRDEQPGHAQVLAHLAREEAEKPLQRAQLTGSVLFDQACRILQQAGNGVRIENLLAALASVGGQQCLEPILHALVKQGKQPQDIGMMVVKGDDERLYFFGDAPNTPLLESPTSLLGLAFGAAQQLGAPVTLDMIHAEMAAVAKSVGTGDAFFAFDLPERHAIDSPLAWAAHFGPAFVETCDLYRMPPQQRAAAFGFALQRAIDAGKHTIDPLMAARIVLGCAVRTAKIDPAYVASVRSRAAA